MKYEIIQDKGYFIDKEYLDNLHLYYPIKEEDKDKTFNVLLIDSDSKMKDRLELLGMLLSDIMQHVSLNRPKDDKLTEDNIDIEQAQMIRAMGRFIGYFFGSSSWRDNQLQAFDKDEFLKRIEIIKTFFK